MEAVVNTIISVLVLSSMYILVALGFALLLSIMGVLNFSGSVLSSEIIIENADLVG